MKNILLIILLGVSLILFKDQQAQTYTTQTEVLSSGGGTSTGGTLSNFGVVGETFVNDATTANNLTNYSGFIYTSGFEIQLTIDVQAFLEGPFNTTSMTTHLNLFGLLPSSQPYNVAPWNYTGTENVGSIPTNAVDWILIELRDAPDATSATSATALSQQAAFILSDGSIVGLDGASNLQFNNSITQQLFVVIYHRNHLSIMSANPLTETSGVYSYDFNDDVNKAFGGEIAQTEIATGIWGMMAGDADANGQIDNVDKNDHWLIQNGSPPDYLQSDFNFNAFVTIEDKDKWESNSGKASQVPE
jgi:hypothetical protein